MGFLVWLGIVAVSVFIYIICNHTKAGKARNERKAQLKEAEQRAYYEKRYKGKPVAYITKDGKQIFADIFAASDALGLEYTRIWCRANTESRFTYEPKDSLGSIECKFYWVNK